MARGETRVIGDMLAEYYTVSGPKGFVPVICKGQYEAVQVFCGVTVFPAPWQIHAHYAGGHTRLIALFDEGGLD